VKADKNVKKFGGGDIYGGFTASNIRRLIWRAVIFPGDFRLLGLNFLLSVVQWLGRQTETLQQRACVAPIGQLFCALIGPSRSAFDAESAAATCRANWYASRTRSAASRDQLTPPKHYKGHHRVSSLRWSAALEWRSMHWWCVIYRLRCYTTTFRTLRQRLLQTASWRPHRSLTLITTTESDRESIAAIQSCRFVCSAITCRLQSLQVSHLSTLANFQT